MVELDALIAVVDDDEDVCRAIGRVLSAHGYRVRQFTSAQLYIEACPRMGHSCVLTDIRMPGIDGLGMLRAAIELRVTVPTVFMTATGDIPTVVEAMRLGACGVLAKPFAASDLVAAVERAIDRHRRLIESHRELAQLWRSAERLTPREAEVGALVASGMLNKQVAALIRTSEKTVKVHRARVAQKLHAASLAELVRQVDRLVADCDRVSIVVDGVEIDRPAVIDILARTRRTADLELRSPIDEDAVGPVLGQSDTPEVQSADPSPTPRAALRRYTRAKSAPAASPISDCRLPPG